MQDILKYTERAGEDTKVLQDALQVCFHCWNTNTFLCLQVMHRVPKACDDMMQVGRLQGFPGKITAQGKLLLQVRTCAFVAKLK